MIKLDNEECIFDVEKVAKSLRIVGVSTKSGGKKYEWIRWDRVNEYLESFGPQVGKIKKGDFIPEPAVYKLAFTASNEVAEKFQDWIIINCSYYVNIYSNYVKTIDITGIKGCFMV